jgi:hypothetical protein
MTSEQAILNIMGQALWDPQPTAGSDLRARQLAAALGYPKTWRVVRAIEDMNIAIPAPAPARPVADPAAAPVLNNDSDKGKSDRQDTIGQQETMVITARTVAPTEISTVEPPTTTTTTTSDEKTAAVDTTTTSTTVTTTTAASTKNAPPSQEAATTETKKDDKAQTEASSASKEDAIEEDPDNTNNNSSSSNAKKDVDKMTVDKETEAATTTKPIIETGNDVSSITTITDDKPKTAAPEAAVEQIDETGNDDSTHNNSSNGDVDMKPVADTVPLTEKNAGKTGAKSNDDSTNNNDTIVLPSSTTSTIEQPTKIPSAAAASEPNNEKVPATTEASSGTFAAEQPQPLPPSPKQDEAVPVVNKNIATRVQQPPPPLQLKQDEIIPTTYASSAADEPTATAKKQIVTKRVIVDRIYAGKPGTDCDMWFNHYAAMQAAQEWDSMIRSSEAAAAAASESPTTTTITLPSPFHFKGGHLLPRVSKFEKNDKVEVYVENKWWDAKILRKNEHAVDGFRYQVHYDVDSSKQSGVEENLIRHRRAVKDPHHTATLLGFDAGWQAVATGHNRWKITSPSGVTYPSKRAALKAAKEEVTKAAAAAAVEVGDPPWRTTGHDYIGLAVVYIQEHAVSARRKIKVEQTGKVVGWISASDVDKAGEPGFVSETTGQPANLFHLEFDDSVYHPYPSYLVQSQDLEEFEVEACLLDIPEEQGEEDVAAGSAKKRARKR